MLISEDGQPLICDFGRSIILFQTGFSTEFATTPRYVAPELIGEPVFTANEQNFNPKPTKEADVYAFGMVCLEVSYHWSVYLCLYL